MDISDSELKIMNILWDSGGDLSAARIFELIEPNTRWHKNTVYTVIKKCIQIEAIQRYEPYYMCHALVSRRDIQKERIQQLIEKYYDGSYEYFCFTFIKLGYINKEVLEV